jgi:serine phosphatase RsbU (regulator of sigma subunit)
VIRTHSERSAAEIARAISDAVTAFRNGHIQEDDITVVLVKATQP